MFTRGAREKNPEKCFGFDDVLLPGRRESLNRLVVAGEAVDTGLDQNETELGIEVLAVDLKVLTDGHGLLDQEVQVLRDLRGET